MRHQQKGFKLGRSTPHRKATLAALSNALIKHKRITTTLTKARALRQHVEPIINRSKADTTHNRRQVFRRLQDKESVKELFSDIAGKIGERPGGYTRIVKLGRRAGDSAQMAVIELVDYNDVKPDGAGGSARTRRTRRGARKRGAAKAATAAAAVDQAAAEAVDTAEDEVEEAVDVAEAATEEVAGETVEAVEEVAEDAVEEGVAEVEEEVAEAAAETTDVADAGVEPEEPEADAEDRKD